MLRGSAAEGREFAALQFTNAGRRTCVLAGYPTVTLRQHGRNVGTVSQPAAAAQSRMSLRPGETAQSRLDDYIGCQAPLSDELHVVVPGSTTAVTQPAQLRACTLRVGALSRA